MEFFKKRFLLFPLLLLATVFSLASCKEQPEEPKDDFIPVVRFAVTSDVHIRSYDTSKSPQDYNSHAILEHFCESVYDYSESQSYNKLDAIFFVGDMTQTGYDDEFEDFFNIVNANIKDETLVRTILGNHEFRATRYDDGTNKDDRYSNTSVAATFEKYLAYGEYDEADAHLLVGDYHCIILNMDRYADYVKFTPERLAWLEKRLKIAAAEDPTGEKPIFVFQHVPASETVNGLTSGGDTALRKVLKKFPQVVDFSGHSHYSLTNPRSIWQEEFTAINTGGLAYLSISLFMDGKSTTVKAVDNNGAWEKTSSESEIRNGGLYYFVEIDASHNIRLVMYNLFTDSVEKIISIGKVSEKSIGSYEDRKAASETPAFAQGTKISSTFIGKNRAILSIPQASCADGVASYRVELYQGDALLQTTYRLSCNYLGSAMPASISAPLEDLSPSTIYTVKVFPVSEWRKEGVPIEYSFTTAGADDLRPDVFSAIFHTDGSATNAVTGEALDAYKAPAVYYDGTLGRNVASLDGTNSYVFAPMYDTYAAITDGFTLETYLYLDMYSTSTIYPIGHMQSGGFGLQIKNGDLQFLVYTGNKAYERASAPMRYGEWVHVIAQYDGKTISLYMNGEKVSEVEATSAEWTLPTAGARYLVIGGDATHQSYVGTSFSRCQISVISLYSTALTDEEIRAIYQANK